MSKFKESLLKKNPLSLEEVNKRAYKYIHLDEADKRADKGWGKRQMEEAHLRSPEQKKAEHALDRIRAPDTRYSGADLRWSNAFSRLQNEKKKEEKGGKIEYLTPLSASIGSIFLEIEDKRIMSRPPKQKTSQYKKDMSKYCPYHKDHNHDTDDCKHLEIEIEKISLSLEEVNKRAYKYIRLDEADKRADKGWGKRQMEEAHLRSPEQKKAEHALDRIRAPDTRYSGADLRWSNALPLVGLTGNVVSPLGVTNLMMTMGKHP
ncbi:hypothetical protein LIER_20321 [Lithospermum erythrorhizon]|uniref:Pre-mRNA-splicing factor SLU7 n=1 Tax=Lithospermum erythrorhizon TaxID=34254 RepID=A0AAV3QPJ5_LITER